VWKVTSSRQQYIIKPVDFAQFNEAINIWASMGSAESHPAKLEHHWFLTNALEQAAFDKWSKLNWLAGDNLGFSIADWIRAG